MRSVFYPRLVNGPFGDPALYVRLAHRGEALLFDCGDLHALTPRELLKVSDVFISHGHIDHLIGFDTLLRQLLYQPTRLRVHGPPGLADQIAGRLSGYTWNLIEGYPLELVVREWGQEGGRTVLFRATNRFRPEPQGPAPASAGLLLDHPDYRVRALPLDHGGILCLAFALEETLHVAVHKDALERLGWRPGPWLTRFKELVRRGAPPATPVRVPAKDGTEQTLPLGEVLRRIAHRERGMKICYVTDVAPSRENLEKIVSFAADAHLLAIEATFADAERERARQRNHLTARLAGETARRAGAAKLLVFHHSPRYQQHPRKLAAEARAAFEESNANSESLSGNQPGT